MEFLLFIIITFFVIVGGFTLLGKMLGNVFFPKQDNESHIHHHYHDNRSINVGEETFKNLKS